MGRVFSLLILTLLAPLSALAELTLLEWRPAGYDYPFLIARRGGEAPRESLERYLHSIETNPRLKPFAENLRAGIPGNFTPHIGGREPLVLGISNDPKDLLAKPERPHKMLDPLAKRGARPLLAPVAPTSGLSPAEAAEYRKLISQHVDMLVSMGGDDINPALYGHRITHSAREEILPARDMDEFLLVKKYMQDGNGFFFGVCRGSQIAGATAGCTLIQDIKKELLVDHPRWVDHPVYMDRDTAGPLTREIFAGQEWVRTNSNHHQMVLGGGKNMRVTGYAVEGGKRITEVSEYFNGRGIGFQFHPELMEGALHERVYDVIFRQGVEARDRRLARSVWHLRHGWPEAELCRRAFQLI